MTRAMSTYTMPVSQSQGESTPIGSPLASVSVLMTGEKSTSVETRTVTTVSVISSPYRARRLGGAGSAAGVQGRIAVRRSPGVRSMIAKASVVHTAMWTPVVRAVPMLSPMTRPTVLAPDDLHEPDRGGDSRHHGREHGRQQSHVVEVELGPDEVEWTIGVPCGQPGRVAEFGEHRDLGLGGVDSGFEAIVDGVGDGGAQLLLDVGALPLGQAAQDRLDVPVGESGRGGRGGHDSPFSVRNAAWRSSQSRLRVSASARPSPLVR